MAIVVHVTREGSVLSVNAKQNGVWVECDDSFLTLPAALAYAQWLAWALCAKEIVCDWSGEVIPRDDRIKHHVSCTRG